MAGKMTGDRLSALDEIAQEAKGTDNPDTGDMPEMDAAADTGDMGDMTDMEAQADVTDMEATADVTEAPDMPDAETTTTDPAQEKISALEAQNAELMSKLDAMSAKLDALSQAEMADDMPEADAAPDTGGDPLDTSLREVAAAIYEGDEDVLVDKLKAVLKQVQADPGALAGQVAETMQSQQAQRDAFNKTIADFAAKYGIADNDQESWAHVDALVAGYQARYGMGFNEALELAGQQMQKYRTPTQAESPAKASLEAKAAAKDDIDVVGGASSRATKPSTAPPMGMDDKLADLASGRVGKYVG